MIWTLIGFAVVMPAALFMHAIVSTALLANRIGNDPIAIWKHVGTQTIGRFHSRIQSRIYAFVLNFVNPYAQSMNIRFTKVERGHCQAYVDETRSIRNPFRSIHAAALVLLAETVGGMTMFTQLQKKDRALVQNISCEYFKKSRGRVVADSLVGERPKSSGLVKQQVMLVDREGDKVACAEITWNVKLGDA